MLQSRYYLATGTSDYNVPDFENLPAIIEEIAQVKAALHELGYIPAIENLPLHPNREQLSTALERVFSDQSRKPDDEIILYYCGHGWSDERHNLVLQDGHRYPTEDLFRIIARAPVARSVLIVLDTCHSGQMTLDIGKILASFEARLENAECCIRLENAECCITVVASSRSLQPAKAGAFTPAFAKVIRNDDRRLGGPSQKSIPLVEVMTAIKQQLPEWQKTKVDDFPTTYNGITPFAFPNRLFDPSVPEGLDLETQRKWIERTTHWEPRTRYFTGRVEPLRVIESWLGSGEAATGTAVVVTGGPGTGKSAILANIVIRGLTDIAIHARGRTLEQIMETLGRAAGIEPTIPLDFADDRARAAAIAEGLM